MELNNNGITTSKTSGITGILFILALTAGGFYGGTLYSGKVAEARGQLAGELSACKQIVGGVTSMAAAFAGTLPVTVTCIQENNKTYLNVSMLGQNTKLNLDLTEVK